MLISDKSMFYLNRAQNTRKLKKQKKNKKKTNKQNLYCVLNEQIIYTPLLF